MNNLDRREFIENAESLMVHFCEECFLYKQLKQEGGRRFAHRFCISQCTVGDMLKDIGKKLS